MSNKKWIVLFPGNNYTVNHPLLYYAGLTFENRGYQKLCVNYGEDIMQAADINELIERADSILPQLTELTREPCEDIVFISKSLGTLLAPKVEDMLKIKARHIFLTPLKPTLPYMKEGRTIIAAVSGTNDPHLSAEELTKHCEKENLHSLLFKNADHALKVSGDVAKSLDILKELTVLYDKSAR